MVGPNNSIIVFILVTTIIKEYLYTKYIHTRVDDNFN